MLLFFHSLSIFLIGQYASFLGIRLDGIYDKVETFFLSFLVTKVVTFTLSVILSSCGVGNVSHKK